MAGRRRKKRAVHDIVGEILHNAKDGVRKTRIMHDCNLSFRMLKKYLKALEKAGFIAENSGVWKTTEKGLHAIEACKLCQSLMKEVR